MSCDFEPNPQANHALKVPPDLGRAIDSTKEIDFLGIVEVYRASACLLRLVVNSNTAFPPGCDCSVPNDLNEAPKDEHSTPRSATKVELSQKHLDIVEALTEKDAVLFRVGLERFETDIARAEARWGIQILCDKDIETLKAVRQDYGFKLLP